MRSGEEKQLRTRKKDISVELSTRDKEITRRLDEDPQLSMRALAREMGLSHERVRQIWTLAHPGQCRRHHGVGSRSEREEDPEIVRRLDENPRLSMTILSEETGVGRKSIANVWHRAHPGEERPGPSRRSGKAMKAELRRSLEIVQ